MGDRIGRRSLTGTPAVRADTLPCMRGAVIIERELVLRPGDRPHLAA
jgi:hypothetical protein